MLAIHAASHVDHMLAYGSVFLHTCSYGPLLGGPLGHQIYTINKNYPYHTSPSNPKKKTKLRIQHYSSGKSSNLCPHMSSGNVYH